MPEEDVKTDGPTRSEELVRRLDRLEQEYMRENRWWRGGLIAALVFVSIAILIGAFHHPRTLRIFGPIAMGGPAGMPGPTGYPGYGPQPPPPPPWVYGYGPGYGYGQGYGWERHGGSAPGDHNPGGGPGGSGGSAGGPPPPQSNG